MGKNTVKVTPNWFTVRKVVPNIWGIAELEHFEEVISYLIVGEEKALLFDTGLGIKNIKNEIKKITNKSITVINSHSHFDHIGGNKLFKNVLDPILTHTIKLKPFLFKVIKTPGHSPDSVCLYEPGNKWLFSGDTLYPGPIYLHLPESDIEDYKQSLKQLLVLKVNKIFPAHNDFKMDVNTIGKINVILRQKSNDKKIRIDHCTSLLIK